MLPPRYQYPPNEERYGMFYMVPERIVPFHGRKTPGRAERYDKLRDWERLGNLKIDGVRMDRVKISAVMQSSMRIVCDDKVKVTINHMSDEPIVYEDTGLEFPSSELMAELNIAMYCLFGVAS